MNIILAAYGVIGASLSLYQALSLRRYCDVFAKNNPIISKYPNLYKVIGACQHTPSEEIAKCAKSALIKAHPDKGGNAELFNDINTIKTIILNPTEKSKYDYYLIMQTSIFGKIFIFSMFAMLWPLRVAMMFF